MQTVTQLLSLLPSGDPQVHGTLFANVYPELKRIAARHMRFEYRSRTMQVTGLVHEAYMRLANQPASPWRDRLHFFGLASSMMRRILVDQARSRLALKRGAGIQQQQELTRRFHPNPIHNPAEFMDLHEALERLASIDSRQAQIVEMRFFGGWTEEEIAQALNISSRTVKRDWLIAKAWLYGELAR
jgi:RNA polymerase sigma-70 factor, ECF subfamily